MQSMLLQQISHRLQTNACPFLPPGENITGKGEIRQKSTTRKYLKTSLELWVSFVQEIAP